VGATLTAAYVLAGCVGAIVGVYLLVLAIAALFYRGQRHEGVAPKERLLVLIPAHNEAALIGRCVQSLLAQSYPAGLYSVVVVADNCTDDTSAVAAAAGAHLVMVRNEPDARGKGHALRWAMDRLLREQSDASAIAVVDADSVADPDFLAALIQPLRDGPRAVQGESLLYGDGSAASALRVAAFLLVNRVRPAGRAVLGLPATHLAGNGMLLARELLLTRPWRAFTSAEDLEYSVDLHLAGVRIAFAGGAVLRSPCAPNARAAAQQQLRWEGGKVHLARTWIPSLLGTAIRKRRPVLLGMAFELALPPLGLLAAILLLGTLVGGALALAALLPGWALTPWILGSATIPLFVVVGLRAGHASRSDYRALARAPLFVLNKPLQAHATWGFRGDTWMRTERPAPAESKSER
jgi:1,2-diacylglycerol 3-beta-glucosyltransferase